MNRLRTSLIVALSLALSLFVCAEHLEADTLTYSLTPAGPVEAAPGSDILFSLMTNEDLPDLDNLTADIEPGAFAEPGSQPGYSGVLAGSGFEDSFILDFFGDNLPAGLYNDIFDLHILKTAPVATAITLDFKTEATELNGLTSNVVSNAVEIQVAPGPVPEPASCTMLAGAVGVIVWIARKRRFGARA
jgi:hypothetical protein